MRSFDICEDAPHPEAEHLTGDIRDYQSLAPAFAERDTVFHTAAIINTLGIARDSVRRKVWGINALGTQNVVRAAQNHGVGTLVHTSSFNVVMNRPIDEGDEELPYADDGFDLYTLSKIAGERIALAAGKQ